MKTIEPLLKRYEKKIVSHGSLTYRSPDRIYSGDCIICKEFFITRYGFTCHCSRECFRRNSVMSGENNPNWKGGTTNRKGYKVFKLGGKIIRKHRHIMEQHLCRKLLPTEVIHHINHIRDDNRIENLQIMSPSDHARLHDNIHK